MQKQIEQALAAVLKRGNANDQSARAKKKEERAARGRLPDDAWCKSGTCQYDHDRKHPGKPCYNDPRVEITISYEASQANGYKGRLEERRAVQGKKLGVTPKPVKVAPQGAPVNPATVAKQFDGMDDWGRGSLSIGDIASGGAPLNPITHDGAQVPDAPTVQGTPVFYTADELRDSLESDDDDSDGSDCSSMPDPVDPSDSSGDEDTGRVVSATWAPPASQDARRRAPFADC